MTKFAVVLSAMLALAISAMAQTASRSVTNSDLEKYRQIRIAADREYRETYAAKGLPSPEEITRRNDAKQKASEELATRLRQEALEREKLLAEVQSRQASAPRNVTVIIPDSGYDNTIYSAGWYSGSRFGRRFGSRWFHPKVLSGYAAGGMLWPAPVGEKPPHILYPRPFGRRRR